MQAGRERDLTALYMGSNYKSFDDLLQKQRITLDSEMKKINQELYLNSEATFSFFLFGNDMIDTNYYNKILYGMKQLPKIREKVESKQSDFADIFLSEYSKLLTTPILDNFTQIRHLISDNEVLSLISLLNKLDIAKDNTGKERGFVAYFMARKIPMFSDELKQWEEFKTKSLAFLSPQMLNKEIEDKINHLYSVASTKEMLLNLEDITIAIEVDAERGDYKEEISDWFTFQTQKISLLSKIQILLFDELRKKSENIADYKSLLLIFAAMLWIVAIAGLVWYHQKIVNNDRDENKVFLLEEGDNIHFESIIALLTKIAKSDGNISKPEKDVINYTMNNFITIAKNQGMNSTQLIELKETMNNAYRKAKQDNSTMKTHAEKLEGSKFDMKVQILKQLVSMAVIDGYSIRKKMLIYEAVEAIGFDKLRIQKYINEIIGEENKKDIEQNLDDACPYDVLGCKITDDKHTIKQKYREQIKEFHPDYIQGKGLNDEIIKFAEFKMKQINQAYDKIKDKKK